MNKKAFSLIIIFVLLATPLLPVLAQGACGAFTCVDIQNFDSNIDNWTAADSHTNVTWLFSKSFGFIFTSSAQGVLEVVAPGQTTGTFYISKQIYLQPARYRIVFRAAANTGLLNLGQPIVGMSASGGGVSLTQDMGTVSVGSRFDVFQSDPVTILEPGPVTFTINGGDDGHVFFDYIFVVEDSISPTPTPNPTFPTETPYPYTPVPTNQQATPIASATTYCLNATATPTPGPAQFGTPAAPTSTPNASINWSILDHFLGLLDGSIWNVKGNVSTSGGLNHSGANSGSVIIPYSSGTQADRAALVYRSGSAFALPFYVDGFAQADVVPTGETALLEVWYYDNDTSAWVEADEVNISARRWYPFHITIDSADTVTAVELVASRSDTPANGRIYVDDLYLYGDLGNSPHCDGSYPSTSTIANTQPYLDPGTTLLTWPADRPCPPAIMQVANNFFGPILSAITIFLYTISASLPTHVPNSITELVRNLIASPVGTFVALTGIYIDWTIPLSLGAIAVTLEVARWLLSIWPTIRKYIPFL